MFFLCERVAQAIVLGRQFLGNLFARLDFSFKSEPSCSELLNIEFEFADGPGFLARAFANIESVIVRFALRIRTEPVVAERDCLEFGGVVFRDSLIDFFILISHMRILARDRRNSIRQCHQFCRLS